MDGIVSNQQQHQRKKEWRVIAPVDTATTRMSIPQVRHRFPGPPHQRSSDKLSKNGEEQVDHGDQPLDDIEDLQHQLGEISRQREQFQQMELELQVRLVARSEILRLQASFDKQAKQHNEIVNGLQEQLQQREEQLQQLQQHSEERERQLQMEATESRNQVWAKDSLLRDQTNEMATLRRERDNALAEHKADAAQLAEQLVEVESLKEQVHEKERRLQELEEQELFFPNDKQLREARLWMARSHEVEAFHVNAMQLEIRERTEQMTQMWVNCQRQVSEVERYYQQMIHKLQQDYEANHFVRSKEMIMDVAMRGSKVMEPGVAVHHQPPMMHMEGAIPMLIPPDGLAPPPIEHATGLPVMQPMVGLTSIVPPAGSPYGPVQPGPSIQFHQPGQLQPVPSPVPPPVVVAQRTPLKPALGLNQHPVQVIQRQQRPIEQKSPSSQSAEPSLSGQNGNQLFPPKQHAFDQSQTEQQSPEVPPKQHAGTFNSVIERSKAPKAEQSVTELETRNGHQHQQNRELEQDKVSPSPAIPETPDHGNGDVSNSREQEVKGEVPTPLSQAPVTGNDSNGNVPESQLLDKASLLACLVRVIPAEPGSKIRISTTLPNRLAKVLTPLHWHDYRKLYGRLDDFVEAHSQFFVVEGDYVYRREGAHAAVAASAAAAKAAAAALAATVTTVPASSVALTPVAQPQSQQQRSRSSKPGTGGGINVDHHEKRRTKQQVEANGQVNSFTPNKSVNFKPDPKRLSGFKENGYVLDGYMHFNESRDYFKEPRDQDLAARPQTQEGLILEA